MWGITGTKIYCSDFLVRLELSYEIGFQGKIYFLWDPFLSGRASIPGKFIIEGSDERESVFKENLKNNPVHTDSELFVEKREISIVKNIDEI